MTTPRYTFTHTQELVDPRTCEIVDTTVEVVEHLTAEEAARITRAQVESWRHLGYTVREGDRWTTAVTLEAMASVRVDQEVGA